MQIDELIAMAHDKRFGGNVMDAEKLYLYTCILVYLYLYTWRPLSGAADMPPMNWEFYIPLAATV